MGNKLTVVARIRAQPGRTDEVREALLGLVWPTRKEAGCINYDLHQSQEDPTLFLFYENWESPEALDAHGRSAHIQAFRARSGELLAAPVLLELFTPV